MVGGRRTIFFMHACYFGPVTSSTILEAVVVSLVQRGERGEFWAREFSERAEEESVNALNYQADEQQRAELSDDDGK